jgi:hypothetical protein
MLWEGIEGRERRWVCAALSGRGWRWRWAMEQQRRRW